MTLNIEEVSGSFGVRLVITDIKQLFETLIIGWVIKNFLSLVLCSPPSSVSFAVFFITNSVKYNVGVIKYLYYYVRY
jgi:hypothetical protein